MQYPEPGTVRWYVSEFIRRHYAGGTPVLEIGSRCEPWQWWRDVRSQLEVVPEQWTGLDMVAGHGVDIVLDLVVDDVPDNMRGVYRTVVCAEVLEHVSNPTSVLCNIKKMLAPGGKLIITTPFAFPVHNYPSDYWRYTPDGLRLLLTDAGFSGIHVEEMNHSEITLYDHDATPVRRRVPLHIGAVAIK
jgi:SAM-dependent methyltransferase